MDLQLIRLLLDFGLMVLIWIVQLVIYPGLCYYKNEDLGKWHKIYTQRIGVIVGPLMIAQLAVTRAEVALDSPVFERVPVASRSGCRKTTGHETIVTRSGPAGGTRLYSACGSAPAQGNESWSGPESPPLRGASTPPIRRNSNVWSRVSFPDRRNRDPGRRAV